MQELVKCEFCGVFRKQITALHVKSHGFQSLAEYRRRFPDAKIYTEATLQSRRDSRKILITDPIESTGKDHNLAVPSHRKNKQISYDKFLNQLAQGLSLNAIIATGVSKHQVAFLSALAQGRIRITKEQFEEEYRLGCSLEEIGRHYDIPKQWSGFLREHFGIKRLGAKYINRKATEKPLTERQKKIVYGTLMGDGSRLSNSSLRIKQTTDHREYVEWLYGQLLEHVSPDSFKEDSSYDSRYEKDYKSLRFYTNANTDIENILKQFYSTGNKRPNAEILQQLDELSVAVWFMDDGGTDWKQRQIDDGFKAHPSSFLCTDSFTKEEVGTICNWFNDKWSIKPETRQRGEDSTGKPKFRVWFSVEETPKLFNLIRQHIVPSMMYKVDYESYLKQVKPGNR